VENVIENLKFAIGVDYDKVLAMREKNTDTELPEALGEVFSEEK
jgi:hypothetical protein